MALNLSVWEDSGPALSGHGTLRQEVDNLGYKESGFDETYHYADYPIGRPIDDELFTTSFKKYYYFKFDGTYDSVSNVAVLLNGDPEGAGSGSGFAGNIRVLYKWTNVYEEPDNVLLNGTTYDPTDPPVWRPKLSIIGPEDATTHVDNINPNQTYYSAYLVTQVFVDKSDDIDYGNLEQGFKLQMILNEEKNGLPGFDADAINWSP